MHIYIYLYIYIYKVNRLEKYEGEVYGNTSIDLGSGFSKGDIL
jgi:hypothetical protein